MLAPILAWARPPLPADAPAVHVGSRSCSASTCHGASEALTFSSIQQNEFHVWKQLDRHSRSYKTLQSAAAAAIVRRLGETRPATELDRCLDCHTDNVPASRRGENFALSDGVGCEACHGGAEPWLATHSRFGTVHAENVAKGMFPTDEPAARARLCLGCHQGAPGRQMTHGLLGAGHPRLALELDTFSLARPAHHVEDVDYQQRKPGQSPLRTWALGQVQSVLDWMPLREPLQPGTGFWPELSVFECYGCHRDMGRKHARGIHEPRLDLTRLLMMDVLLGTVAPEQAAAWKRTGDALHRIASWDETENLFGQLRSLGEKARDTVSAYSFQSADAKALLRALDQRARQGELDNYAAAEQATYASGVMVAVLAPEGPSPKVAALQEDVYKAVDDPGRFKAAEWRKALGALAGEFAQ